LGHPCKFQRASSVGFVTAPTSVNGRQPNFARCLAVSCADTLYIHFRGLFTVKDFYQVQNSLYVQILRSPILAALLHGTRVVEVSQTLRRGRLHGMELRNFWQRTPLIFSWAAIPLAIGPHSTFVSILHGLPASLYEIAAFIAFIERVG